MKLGGRLALALAILLNLPAISLADEAMEHAFTATQAGENKFSLCSSCHVLSDQIDAAESSYSSLGGMEYSYIQKQLVDYREGRLENPAMQAMTAALSNQDIDYLSSYIASYPIK